MKTVEAVCTAEFTSPVSRVWDLVTDNAHTSWRSDVHRVEAQGDGSRFTEYTKGGFATEFVVTEKQPCRRYGFDLENPNLRGHWSGEFTERAGGSRLKFTETLTVRRFPMTLLAKPYLLRQQRRYVRDLKAALGESGR